MKQPPKASPTPRSKRALAALLAASLLAPVAFATETEHNDFHILPAPGKVTIDGKFEDWDLSGSMFICSDVESYRDQFASWQSAMYDSENLYLLTRWIDTTPMNNPGLAGSDMGFQGDCLQVRFIIRGGGSVDLRAQDDTVNQRTSHITAWSGKDGRNIIDIAYGKSLNDGGDIKDGKKQGCEQAFVKNADGKGYTQEIAIPWKLITRDGKPPKAGDVIAMTYEPNFSTSSKMRVSTKDLFRAGVTPDRIFAFGNYPCWGTSKFEAGGKIAPLPLRLSDGRTFPVTMENGLPVVNWKGLYKEDKLDGFAKIDLQMPEDGFVSLVIKNGEGQIVRNLLNAKFLTKGEQEVLWDGLTTPSDRVPGAIVPEGNYTWEAIWHKGIGLSLVGWACNAGKAPFDSPGGNWGGDMGAPCSVDSDNEHVYLGWSAAEAGQALVCTDFEGNVKWRHKRGGFGGAALVAADKGIVFVYDEGQGNAIYRLDSTKGEYSNWKGAEEAVLPLEGILAAAKPADAKEAPVLSGLAAIDGKLFLSYGPINAGWGQPQPSGNTVFVLDQSSGKVLQKIAVENPCDLKVGADNKLYLVTGTTGVSRIDPASGAVEKVVDGLNYIHSVTADKEGNVYAGMRDPDNQVKVFDKAGKPLRTIGKAGGRNLLGPWDKNGMRFIGEVKIDPAGQLWVMESDTMPRRISVWNPQTGALAKELFGPTDYGAGGGAICPTDPYTEVGHGCEWKISQDSGKAECIANIARMNWHNARFGTGKDGRVYLAVGAGWPEHQPVSIFERLAPGNWKLRTVISTKEIQAEPTHITVWSDRNDDQKEQPDEVKTFELPLGGWIDGWYMYFNQAMTFSGGLYRIDVTGWTACGAPEYDLGKAVKLPAPDDISQRGGMGAQKGLVSEDGNTVIYNGLYGTEHSDFSAYDIKSGRQLFAYPNNYVGVHGGHLAPPAKTGLIRGAYDIVGTVKMPDPLGNLFAIATDKGEWHLISSTGYYITSLFEGDTMKMKWPEEAVPGANMSTVPPGMGAEDFGGSLIRTADGQVYIQCGKTAFIDVKVNGLDTVKSLGSGSLKIGAQETVQAERMKVKYLSVSDSVKSVDAAKKSVTFTGKPEADFGVGALAFGPDNARIGGWLAHDDQTLFVAWEVNDKTPWVNGATGFENLYACGDTVDLQLGTDPAADPKRGDAVKGDLRLSIGQLNGKNTAVIYRRVSDEKAAKTFFSGTSKGGYVMEFVKVLDDVKIETKIVGDKQYVVEAAIPMKDLGVASKAGLMVRGDLGATFGDPAGKDTTLRVYWSNQAAGIVADEVEELKMQPAMWGAFTLE